MNKIKENLLMILILLAMTTATAAYMDESIAYKKIKKVIENNTEDDLLYLPTSEEEEFESTKICNGKQLIKQIEKNAIDYVLYGNQMYTKDGRVIAKLLLRVNHIETIKATLTQNKNGAYVYVAPDGYKVLGAYGIKKTEDYITVFHEIDETGKYKDLNSNECEVLEILEINLIETLPFSELEKMSLNMENSNANTNQLTYKFIPKK